MPKNPDLTIDSANGLIIRAAQLEEEMIAAKQGDDPAAARAAKEELRAFRQHWRGIRDWVAFCNLNDIDPRDGVAAPDAIATTAKAQEV